MTSSQGFAEEFVVPFGRVECEPYNRKLKMMFCVNLFSDAIMRYECQKKYVKSLPINGMKIIIS